MIDYEEIGNFIKNVRDIKNYQQAYDEQLAFINDERIHHPDKMTDKECTAYCKLTSLIHHTAESDTKEADAQKKLAQKCLERQPNDEQLSTILAVTYIYSDIESTRRFPPFYALYKDDFIGEYQNSCNIITAMGNGIKYSEKIFGKTDLDADIVLTLKKMLEVNYQQSTLAADDDFFNKKRPYHLSDIKTSLILDKFAKIVDNDSFRETQISEILHDLSGNKAFQAAAERHPALAVTFTNVAQKCIQAATKNAEERIFKGFGKRLQLIAQEHQEATRSTSSQKTR